MPEFYINITRKIFFLDFFLGGGGTPPAPVSYAYETHGQRGKDFYIKPYLSERDIFQS